MRAVVQRVREAAVSVGGTTVGAIGEGLLVLCGITALDGDAASVARSATGSRARNTAARRMAVRPYLKSD